MVVYLTDYPYINYYSNTFCHDRYKPLLSQSLIGEEYLSPHKGVFRIDITINKVSYLVLPQFLCLLDKCK